MPEEQIDNGSYELNTIYFEGKMYVDIEDIIGWLKLNQNKIEDIHAFEVVHYIIRSLVRTKNIHIKR